jgi:hypothetical protein
VKCEGFAAFPNMDGQIEDFLELQKSHGLDFTTASSPQGGHIKYIRWTLHENKFRFYDLGFQLT